MWAEMKMNPTDLADVSGYTYTYLMNGQALLKTGPDCSVPVKRYAYGLSTARQ
ncbi:hypothetical protein JS565_16240 [Salmonella enterica subsp. enterica serovar Senftenberg]|nr:hypothetical protein [Salmonella enterica subsp. enterica serovar Senftenberg]